MSCDDLQSEGFLASDVQCELHELHWCSQTTGHESARGPSLFSSLHSWLIHHECGELCILEGHHAARFRIHSLILEVFVGGLLTDFF